MASYADMAAKGPKQTDAEKVPDAVPEILHEDSGVHTINVATAHKNAVPSYAEQQRVKEEADKAEEEAKASADRTAQQARDFAEQAEQDLARLEVEGSETTQDTTKEIKASLTKLRAEGGKQFEQAAKDVQANLDKLAEKGSKQYQQFADSTNESLKKLKESMATWDNDAGQKINEFQAEVNKQYESIKKEAKVEGQHAKKNAREAGEWADRNKGNPVVIGNSVVLAALGGILGIGAYRMHRAGTLTWNVAGAWAGALGLFAIGDFYVSQYFFKRNPTK